MYAQMIEGKWRQFQAEAHAWWGHVAELRSGADTENSVRAAMKSLAVYARQSRIIPKVLVSLLITMAILAATYLAAANLVDGAASHSLARANHATVLQQAALNYRQARAQCQRGSVNSRDACIVEAHAEESRARAVASLAPRRHVVALRSQTDAAIDAGDQDGIVIEPACNVVERGQASICEIQVKSDAASVRATTASQGW